MARTGRKPLPANVVRMRGNRSKLGRGELEERERSEPKPQPIAMQVPKDLTPHEAECWRMHAGELRRLQLLTMLDVASFRFACTDYALARHSLEEMRPRKKDGTIDKRRKGFAVVVTDEDGAVRRHPAFLTYRQSVESYRAWCARFGLTPSDRVNLRPAAGVGPPEADDADDDEAFFGS